MPFTPPRGARPDGNAPCSSRPWRGQRAPQRHSARGASPVPPPALDLASSAGPSQPTVSCADQQRRGFPRQAGQREPHRRHPRPRAGRRDNAPHIGLTQARRRPASSAPEAAKLRHLRHAASCGIRRAPWPRIIKSRLVDRRHSQRGPPQRGDQPGLARPSNGRRSVTPSRCEAAAMRPVRSGRAAREPQSAPFRPGRRGVRVDDRGRPCGARP